MWRIIIAVGAVFLFTKLFPPLNNVFKLGIGGDWQTIIWWCVVGIAVYYILRGKTPA